MRTIFYLFVISIFAVSCKQDTVNVKIAGPIFGTSYSVQYYASGAPDFQKEFDNIFHEINASMSTYIDNSIISRINRNEPTQPDAHFINVLRSSRRVHRVTNGAFDPTIGAVVNAWDFGPEGAIANLDSLIIDSLMTSVGIHKIMVSRNLITKKDPNTFLDFNAIAKGYAVDVIAEFLESKNVADYIVEIGGELRTKGINREKNGSWKVGIDQPRFDGGQSVIKAITLKDVAMATSGVYRKFKVDEAGNRYAHIIDTKTGYPTKTNLLSISVISSDCMTADAYATAFKAMKIEDVKTFLGHHPELKAFLIFENSKNEMETLSLNGFPEE